jgi:hypothetical protein
MSGNDCCDECKQHSFWIRGCRDSSPMIEAFIQEHPHQVKSATEVWRASYVLYMGDVINENNMLVMRATIQSSMAELYRAWLNSSNFSSLEIEKAREELESLMEEEALDGQLV